jgi:hypothetical protein
MLYSRLITACLAAKLSMGYLVTPSGTPYPGAVSDCSGWVEGTSGVTCAQVEEAVGITAEDFTTWVGFPYTLFFDTYIKSYSQS